MVQIMDGRALSAEITAKVKAGVEELKKHGVDVSLVLLLVGEDKASIQYSKSTLSAARKTGIKTYEFILPATASINDILNVVNDINYDERINGLLVFLPLPPHIDSRVIVNAISPEKDIDGLGHISIGRLAADESVFQIFQDDTYKSFVDKGCMPSVSGFLPCTPYGVIMLLESYNVDIRGRNAVVIGKSLAVGKPLAMMLLAKEATVTICHRQTYDLASFTCSADIVCSATGVKGLIKGDMVKKGAVVVDIGIKVLEDGSIVGDVDFASVSARASLITPVPGGVGPVTIAMLLKNTLRSARRHEFAKRHLAV